MSPRAGSVTVPRTFRVRASSACRARGRSHTWARTWAQVRDPRDREQTRDRGEQSRGAQGKVTEEKVPRKGRTDEGQMEGQRATKEKANGPNSRPVAGAG